MYLNSLSILRFSAASFLVWSVVAIVCHLASLLLAFLFRKGSKRLALLRSSFWILVVITVFVHQRMYCFTRVFFVLVWLFCFWSIWPNELAHNYYFITTSRMYVYLFILTVACESLVRRHRSYFDCLNLCGEDLRHVSNIFYKLYIYVVYNYSTLRRII